jgi:hypothetical protein
LVKRGPGAEPFDDILAGPFIHPFDLDNSGAKAGGSIYVQGGKAQALLEKIL